MRPQLFDGVADLYASVRPGYPEELADDVLAFAGAGAGDRVLEVGPGTGQATALFARRGLAIDAIEPGPRLAALVRRRVTGRPVRVVEARYEDWNLDAGAYALVIGAQSFHCVEPAVRYAKSARALRAGGTLALFWHAPQPGEGPAHEAVQAAYRRHVPDLAVRPADGAWASRVADEIDASGSFGAVHAVRYPWRRRYSGDEYVALLGTYSDHLLMPDEARGQLLAALREAIAEHGGIEVAYELRLYLARRRA